VTAVGAGAGPGGQAAAFRPDRVYLGWQHALTVPDPGPAPVRPPEPPEPREQARDAWLDAQHREEARLDRPYLLAGGCGAALAVAMLAGWLAGPLGGGLAVLSSGAGLTTAAASLRVIYRGRRQLRAQIAAEDQRLAALRGAARRRAAAGQAEHARRVGTWRQHSAAFWRQPRWYPVMLPGGIHRLDVAGGTLEGWAALLTSIAVPRLAAGGEVTVVDLTEGAVGGDLLALARACGIDPLVWVLPADLPRLDLGAGLAGDALADVLALTVSGCDDSGADPARDAALLRQVIGVLGGRPPAAQLGAALRALAQAGDPRDDIRAGLLTARQLDRLTALFGRGATERVVIDRAWAIEARLAPLASLGADPASLPPSRLRLAWLDRRAPALGNQALGAYLTVALTHELRQAPAGRPWRQTLVVLGAEGLPPALLDRLTSACEMARVGLVIGYRSVPEPVSQRLGRGHAAIAWMRLGNAADARAAAEQIGTEHRLVISQLTETIGTSVTGTTGDSYTSTVGTADSVTDSASLTGTTGRSAGRGTSTGGAFASFTPATGSASRDRSTSRALSDSVALTRGVNASTAWGWSTSRALGTSESLAAAAQRSREFLVEQHELQQLAASAVLLSYAGPGGRRVLLADVNPAIIGLPGTTLNGLDDARAAAGGRP
jgi:hypothetical protein